MSFQDIGSTRPSSTRPSVRRKKPSRTEKHHHHHPTMIVATKHTIAMESESPSARKPSTVTPENSPRNDTTSPRNKAKHSRFSILNDEIIQFQGMVRKLEVAVTRSGMSPEDQWRSRILLQSAEETDRDIGIKIRQYQQILGTIMNPAVRSSYAKLIRDFQRIHTSFQSLVNNYNERQLKEISTLGDGSAEILTNEQIQARMVAQREEEFFERAMREREAEVRGINRTLHQVNEIYQELGRIVQNQQEGIDKVENNVKNSKAMTNEGLKQLEESSNFLFCTAMTSDENRQPPPPIIRDEDFRWSLPFETMGDDMKEVQQDILGLGNDLVFTGKRKLQAASVMLQCASPRNNVSDKIL